MHHPRLSDLLALGRAAMMGTAMAGLALAALAAPPDKAEKSDTGKPMRPFAAPASSPYKPEKSDTGKPGGPGATAAKAATGGPGTQTEDDAMVGAKNKKTRFP